MKICLVGNQNSGKTTLFNELTGMNQKIGNWPGVTIEKKSGVIRKINLGIVDLPGIYSLNPYTEEEKISTQYIFKEKPDIIINIIDATCLERSLYLTTQLLELNTKVIVVLNMTDILAKKGIKIDISMLKKELQTDIYEISALKKKGIDELILGIEQVTKENSNKAIKKYDLKKCKYCTENCYNSVNKKLYEQIATERYNYISKITIKCLYKKVKWINTTEIFDKIFLSKILSIPIFMIIMFAIYFMSVGVIGKYTSNFMNNFIEIIENLMQGIMIKLNVKEWIQSLILNGAFKGISAVLNFIPQLIILFACISILEATGYMSRIAFILDNIFKKIGLNGKSIIPFIIGTGCSVPRNNVNKGFR